MNSLPIILAAKRREGAGKTIKGGQNKPRLVYMLFKEEFYHCDMVELEVRSWHFHSKDVGARKAAGRQELWEWRRHGSADPPTRLTITLRHAVLQRIMCFYVTFLTAPILREVPLLT